MMLRRLDGDVDGVAIAQLGDQAAMDWKSLMNRVDHKLRQNMKLRRLDGDDCGVAVPRLGDQKVGSRKQFGPRPVWRAWILVVLLILIAGVIAIIHGLFGICVGAGLCGYGLFWWGRFATDGVPPPPHRTIESVSKLCGVLYRASAERKSSERQLARRSAIKDRTSG